MKFDKKSICIGKTFAKRVQNLSIQIENIYCNLVLSIVRSGSGNSVESCHEMHLYIFLLSTFHRIRSMLSWSPLDQMLCRKGFTRLYGRKSARMRGREGVKV